MFWQLLGEVECREYHKDIEVSEGVILSPPIPGPQAPETSCDSGSVWVALQRGSMFPMGNRIASVTLDRDRDADLKSCTKTADYSEGMALRGENNKASVDAPAAADNTSDAQASGHTGLPHQQTGVRLVLRDVPKARREVGLHYAAGQHMHIVRIFDVYENTYNQVKCLLVVMECMQGEVTAIHLVFFSLRFLARRCSGNVTWLHLAYECMLLFICLYLGFPV
uniref:Uncharacterized protein n=1 Tax=Parascaris equorum TaxID=6256 RepID=A0A914RXN0_PAREQ